VRKKAPVSRRRWAVGVALALVACAFAAGLASVGAQSPAAGPAGTKNWTVPRTPDGHPDLQGTWSNATMTPLERPANAAGLVMSKEEVAQRERERL
jgi:hypothetical protein